MLKGGIIIKKIVFILALFVLGIYNVHAQTEKMYGGEDIAGMYIRKIDASGKEEVKQGRFIRRTSDDAFVYCVEPFVDLIVDYTYNIHTSDYAEILNISEETWLKIALISYYGYQYDDHTEDYWYYITQMMIWQAVYPEGKFYFTDTLGGKNNLDKYALEIAEIESLVEKHNLHPQFGTIEINAGETKRFADKNNVLQYYKVNNNDNVMIDDNELVITDNNIGLNDVELERINVYDNLPIVYSSSDSQKVMSPGFVNISKTIVRYQINGYSLKLIKVDKLTNEPIKISGIKFAIYDAEDNLVLNAKTDESGEFVSSEILSPGKYKIVELSDQVISGYEINEEPVYFEVNSGDEEIVTVFSNTPVLGKLRVVKIDKLSNEPIKISGIKFAIYDAEDNLVLNAETDELGEFETDEILRVGKYKLVELSDQLVPGYEINKEPIYFEITSDNKDLVIEFPNNPALGEIEILKIDEEGNTLAGVTFGLYQSDNILVDIITTNEEGVALFDNLREGKYYLKELATIEGYLLDEVVREIELKIESGEIMKLCIEVINYKPKGSLEIIKVDKENNPLPETEFVLYDSNMQEISKNKTDEEGKIKIDNLDLGKYYLQETIPAPGYALLEEIIEFNIKENEEHVTITITNDRIKVNIPNTEMSIEVDEYIADDKKKLKKIKL